ncbi:MAG: hypothetical protein FWE53_04325 [Firmicutes bacterium]|nr:hypothetical protein [Bacillota bacterium]
MPALDRNDYLAKALEQSIPMQADLDFVKNNIKTKYSFYSDDGLIQKDILQDYIRQIDSVSKYLTGYRHFGGCDGVHKIPELIKLLEELTGV